MKHIKVKFSLLLFLIPLLSVAQTTIKLTGTVNPAMNGRKFTVLYGDKKIVLDSARVQNGKIQFELQNADSTIVSLATGDKVPLDNINIYIANTDVYFEAKDSIKYAVITGHKDTKDYQRMMQPIDLLIKQRFQAMMKLYKLPKEEQNGKQGIELNEKMREAAKAERLETLKAIDENPKSYIALMLLKSQMRGTISYDEMMSHFEKLSKKLKAMPEGKALEEKLNTVKKLRSGLVANDFESLTPEGKTLKLSEIYPKAKYTFIDFWASWCAPCRAENPNVVKAYENYKDKGLTILSVSLDTKGDLWKAAIEKDGMPWLHVSKLKGFDEPAAVLYGIKMIPQNVLIDSKGKIVATNLRGYALDDKLKTLLK